MAPDQAVEIAANLYAGHPAAAALMLEAINGVTQERRQRSRLALRLLDPAEPLGYLSTTEGPAWQAALAIAYLLVANVSLTRESRRRVAGLLNALCHEAAQVAKMERAA